MKQFHAEGVSLSGADDLRRPSGGGTPSRPASGDLIAAEAADARSGGDGGAEAALGEPARAFPPMDPIPSHPRSLAAQVRSFLLAKGDMSRTRPLIPPRMTVKPSAFVTPELKEIWMVTLSSGGYGMSRTGKVQYFKSVLHAEQKAIEAHARFLGKSADSVPRALSPSAAPLGATHPVGSRSRNRSGKRESLRQREREQPGSTKRRRLCGPVETAFPSPEHFLGALVGEQERCLSEQKRRFTDIAEEGMAYPFMSRCSMGFAHDVVTGAGEVSVKGDPGYNGQNERLRTSTMDSDVFLEEQEDVMRLHDGKKVYKGQKLKAFVLAAQFFSDAAAVTDNGDTSTSDRVLVNGVAVSGARGVLLIASCRVYVGCKLLCKTGCGRLTCPVIFCEISSGPLPGILTLFLSLQSLPHSSALP